MGAPPPALRVGIGYDIHRLAGGIPLMLGGIAVEHPRGAAGHSDGDVVLHALVDALLGAAGLGDIGSHFPPGDPAWRGASSRVFLERTVAMVRDAGWVAHNVDATVILERPRLQEYLPAMRAAIGGGLGIEASAVSIKAKTNEGLDAVGQGLAVAAHVVVLLEERRASP